MVYDAKFRLDLIKNKDVYKKTINNNSFVEELRGRKITVIPFANILNNVRMGQTKYDKKEPSGAIAKQLSGMESLFGSAVKK